MPALVTLTMQAQIEERAERSWKLRDMLHLGKLNVPGSAMDDDGYLMKTSAPPMQPTLVTRPTLVGKSNFSVVEVVSGKWVSTGMPNRKQKGPKNQKWLTKAIVRDKNSGVLTWQEPLVYSPSLKLTLVNKQLSRKDPRRLVLQTLRAMDRFHGKPAYDNIKVEIALDDGISRFYFAQCEAFFQDCKWNLRLLKTFILEPLFALFCNIYFSVDLTLNEMPKRQNVTFYIFQNHELDVEVNIRIMVTDSIHKYFI